MLSILDKNFLPDHLKKQVLENKATDDCKLVKKNTILCRNWEKKLSSVMCSYVDIPNSCKQAV
jgi:hypothetical protein